MTDIDALRRALRAPDETASPPDVEVIIERGRRLRRRRRLAVVAGGACAAAAIFGAVTGAIHLAQPSAVQVRPAGPAGTTPAPPPRHHTARPSISPRAPVATPYPSPTATRPSGSTAPSATPSSSPSPDHGGQSVSPSLTVPGQGASPTFPPDPSPSVFGHPASSPATASPIQSATR